MTNTSYEKLVEVYEKISSTSSRLEKQDIIADFLMYIKETDAPGEIEKQLEDKCFDEEPSSLYGRVDK